MEKTLILFKPDCFEKKVLGQVIDRFEKKGFSIIGSKMIRLNYELLKEHYSHVVHLPFFSDIAEFMSSRPVMAMILEGEDVILRVRELLGPTDSEVAEKGTIRGDLGTNRMKNVVHASDSAESALIEINRFFEADQI